MSVAIMVIHSNHDISIIITLFTIGVHHYQQNINLILFNNYFNKIKIYSRSHPYPIASCILSYIYN